MKTPNFLKTVLLVTIASISLLSASSFAVYMPGWERPVYQARMDILNASGSLIDIKNVELVMTKQDGSKQATGFILTIDGKSVFLEISVIKKLAQNSVQYIAIPLADSPTLGSGVKLLVREIDSKWKTELFYSLPSTQPKASLELEGSKVAVYSAQ